MRRLTPKILASLARDRAEREVPLATKRQAVAALRRALPALDLPLSARALLEELIRLSPPEDWEDGRRPLVWPSNAHLMHRLGLSRASVQRAIRTLLEADLIIACDGPAGRRHGVRAEDGRIAVAHGFDLSRLARRRDAFEASARAHEAARHAIAAKRRAITIDRRAIRALIEAAAETAPADPAALGAVGAALDRLEAEAGPAVLAPSRLPDSRGAEIAWLAGELAALRTRAEAAVHGDGAISEPTNPMPSARASDADNPVTKARSEEHCNAFDETEGGGRPVSDRAMPTVHGAVRSGERGPSSVCETPAPPRPRLPLSAGVIVAACPELKRWTGGDIRRLADLTRFAEGQGLKLLGVSQDAWRDACAAMGEDQATAAIAIILQRVAEAKIDSAGGYLRGMAAKARAGRLDIATTLRWMAGKGRGT